MDLHWDLEVMSLNPSRVEIGVLCTSVRSHTCTESKYTLTLDLENILF